MFLYCKLSGNFHAMITVDIFKSLGLVFIFWRATSMLEVQPGRLSMSTLIIKLTFEDSWTTTGVQHRRGVVFLVKRVESKPVWNMYKGWDHDDQEILTVVGQWSRKLGTQHAKTSLTLRFNQVSWINIRFKTKWNPEIKIPIFRPFSWFPSYKTNTKTMFFCRFFWGTPHQLFSKLPLGTLALTQPSLETSPARMKLVFMGSATVNNNIQQREDNNMDTGIIADWFVTTQKQLQAEICPSKWFGLI